MNSHRVAYWSRPPAGDVPPRAPAVQIAAARTRRRDARAPAAPPKERQSGRRGDVLRHDRQRREPMPLATRRPRAAKTTDATRRADAERVDVALPGDLRHGERDETRTARRRTTRLEARRAESIATTADVRRDEERLQEPGAPPRPPGSERPPAPREDRPCGCLGGRRAHSASARHSRPPDRRGRRRRARCPPARHVRPRGIGRRRRRDPAGATGASLEERRRRRAGRTSGMRIDFGPRATRRRRPRERETGTLPDELGRPAETGTRPRSPRPRRRAPSALTPSARSRFHDH